MEAHRKNWTPLIAKIEARFRTGFDPKKLTQVHEGLVDLLEREFRDLKKERLLEALTATYRDLKIRVDWERFICRLLFWLPGHWVKLANNPGFNASTMLLLTDGSVMCQEEGGLNWKKLRPDANGSYINGTWVNLAPMHHTRRYYASAVLRDGRVIVSGGEYSDAGSETNKTEIYDPATDSWTGWNRVGDAACAVLPDGRVLLGNLDDTRTAIYDPAANSWTAGPAKGSRSAEESWVLLPDDTVITVRCDSSRRADKYVASSNSWVDGGTLPVGIVETSSSEIGAGVLLPDGRAFFAGANQHTALYTRPVLASDPGTWVSGPDFPNDSNGQTVGCKDSPSCLMTNGKVLISAGPVDGVGNSFLSPTYFFEFNGSSLTRIADPPNATNVPYIGRMLLLPTGQILYAAQTDAIYVYEYFSCPAAAWRPEITSYPSSVRRWHTYTIQGRNFNGLSQAVGYGDDASAATNYPLVRIRNPKTGHVVYCKTFDHSTMGVATGSSIESTQFAVPFLIEAGASEISVVANGIPSAPCPMNVHSFLLEWPLFEEATVVRLIGSLADGPLWVLGPNGPIPVDPWGPLVAQEAAAAWKQFVGAVKTLQELGHQVNANRAKIANAVPHAPDDDDEDEENELAEEPTKKRTRKSRK
jgi:hypothetical protein